MPLLASTLHKEGGKGEMTECEKEERDGCNVAPAVCESCLEDPNLWNLPENISSYLVLHCFSLFAKETCEKCLHLVGLRLTRTHWTSDPTLSPKDAIKAQTLQSGPATQRPLLL